MKLARQGPARPVARAGAVLLAGPRAQPARSPGRGAAPVLSAPTSSASAAYYHDSAAALLQDGEVVAACQEERLSPQEARRRLPRPRGQIRAAGGRHRPRAARRRRLLRQAAAEVRADALHLRRHLPALVRLLPQGDAAVDQGEALGAVAHPQGAAALQGADPLRRAPHEPRRLLLPRLAVRGGGHPHRGRRGRVGHAPASAWARAPTSRSSRRSASPTAWACSTARSPTTSASR